jgi:hypothetical protein
MLQTNAIKFVVINFVLHECIRVSCSHTFFIGFCKHVVGTVPITVTDSDVLKHFSVNTSSLQLTVIASQIQGLQRFFFPLKL